MTGRPVEAGGYDTIAGRPAHAGVSRKECLALLATARIGRVALSVDALPVVLPVRFGMLGEDVVFRSPEGAKFSSPGLDVVLAFQADDFDAASQTGWSVLVQGLARQIVGNEEIEVCRESMRPARSLAEGEAPFVRVATTRMTGRRFVSLAC